MARSWGDFAAQRSRYEGLHSSKDFRRRKPGFLGRLVSFINGLFGR